MFTGIIESMGKITQINSRGTNMAFTISAKLASELRVDQSLSHNGVCLTVVRVSQSDLNYEVVAVAETLGRTNLKSCRPGDFINLERSMSADGRFDGHIVQGHVDQMVICASKEDHDGSWGFRFEYMEKGPHLVVEKGSVCVNGVSLTCFDCQPGGFSVAVIPYTFENTNFQYMEPGNQVNIEFDVIGKYVEKILAR